jgi:hypothetical protein
VAQDGGEELSGSKCGIVAYINKIQFFRICDKLQSAHQ